MSLSAGTRLGPYEIVAPLGAGGMGEVYRARDTRLGRDVAVKILPGRLTSNAEVRARFEREAKTISSLNHPHICTLHDIGREGETDYLVMELVEGETLAERLEKGPLPLKPAIQLGVEIADALAKAHRSGIVHRDLKPANVMVTKSGAKLMDFGLARATGLAGAPKDGGMAISALTHSPTMAAPLTAEGTIVGTFQYMAPEQLEGKEADERSDLWALGCVLYEMLTGKRAFEGTSQASLISSIMKDEPRPVGELIPLVPSTLNRVVRQCLAKDPDERWQSAADLRRELLWIEEAGPAQERPAGRPLEAGTPRRRFLLVAGGVVLAAAIAATGFMAGRRADAPASSSGVSFQALTFKPQGVYSARFMPDGQTTVLSSVVAGNHVELFAIRPEYAEPQPLGAPNTHLLDISKRGEMAVLTGAKWVHHRQFTGTLARMPLGAAAPREILEGVREAAWSPDGENLAIIHLMSGEDRLEYPVGTVLYKTGGFLSDPRVSPDGEKVAFLEHQYRWDDRGVVSVVDRAGHARQLTKVFWGEEGLAWSPDGREVLFSAGVIDLVVQAVDLEGRLRTVLSGAGGLLLQDIASDGRWLATRDEGHNQILGVGLGGETERDLTFLSLNWNLSISADGRLLLFTNGNQEAGPNYAVCFRKTDGSPVIKLGEGDATGLSPDGKWALAVIRSQPPRMVVYPTGPGQQILLERGSVVEYDTPHWFPDGKRVLTCGHEAERPSRCWIQKLEGGAMKPVTPEGVYDGRVSPDGRVIVGWGEETTPALYPVEEGEPRPLPMLTSEDRVIRWSPDGKSLYVRRGKLPVLVDRVDLATGRRERVREIGAGNEAGLVSIGDISFADDPRSFVYSRSSSTSTLFLIKGAR